MRNSTHTPNSSREAVDVLKQLINIDSTSSDSAAFAKDTRAATDFVGNYLQEKTGAEIHYTRDYEYPEGSGKKHKGLVAVWRPKQPTSKPPVAFSAHIDTVPALGEWDGHSPYRAEEDDEKITGRGALDIKGQVASLIATMKAKHDKGELAALDRPVVFMLSSCEEVGLLGAKGVCDLTRDKVGSPDEVIVVEPTDGYIGIGCKGMRQTDIAFHNTAHIDKSRPYQHYMTIEIGSASGHSSLQAASPADPALMATEVLQYVKKLRGESKVEAEVCAVDYGIAANVVGGTAKIVVGYNAPDNDPNGNKIFEKMRRHFETFERIKSNVTLRFFTVAGHLVSALKKQVGGVDLGTVDIKVGRGLHETAPEHPVTTKKEYSNTLKHSPDGTLAAQSAVEHAIEVTSKIYEMHAAERDQGGRAEHYAIPLMGVTKLSVPMLKGDAFDANLSCDMRYPVEAMAGDPSMNIRGVDDISKKIARAANTWTYIKTNVEVKSDIRPYRTCTPSDSRLKPYLDIGAKTRFTRFADKATCVPYSSDGNIIAQEFPDALVMTMAHGGFCQMPHGVGEHLTKKQIADNQALFGTIVDSRARSEEVSRTATAR